MYAFLPSPPLSLPPPPNTNVFNGSIGNVCVWHIIIIIIIIIILKMNQSLVAAGRYYVKEGELTYHKKAKSKSGEKRHVFFFTDLILLTVRKGEKKFEHKLSVPLDSCTLIVLANSNRLFSPLFLTFYSILFIYSFSLLSADLKNAFELTQKQLTKKCILSGETADESNLWVKEIRALIKGYQKRKLRELEDQKKKGNAPSAELLNLSNL